ncbi:MAG: nickel pincer cofactor biosynthesis protein LarC [Acidimicrobiales bacterium]|nr:nickel pincer cofactor biosynthesis protein LarC [Acidimicrobiales bacterium]
MTPRNVAWLHPFSGIAGDMTLGALLDAGAELSFVISTLEGLNVGGWSLTTEQVDRNGIRATRAVVDTPEQHHHRRWSDIRLLLEQGSLPGRVQARALAVFEALAVAEGEVHGLPPDEVHFHEVGALDAIVDIVGSCAALESLNIDEVASGPVAVGVGSISAAHGILPNPPPAVVNLLEGIPTVSVDIDMELTTPTGAAIVKALADRVGPMPDMTIAGSGYGAGTRDLPDRANVTQVVVGTSTEVETAGGKGVETVTELSTNLDDVTGEVLGHAIGQLVDAGALDAWATPIVMKKGRPAHTLSVLATPTDAPHLVDIMMSATGTLGVRTRQIERTVAARRTVTVSVDGHHVDVKVSDFRVKAEFDHVLAAAKALGLPVSEVAARAEALAQEP